MIFGNWNRSWRCNSWGIETWNESPYEAEFQQRLHQFRKYYRSNIAIDIVMVVWKRRRNYWQTFLQRALTNRWQRYYQTREHTMKSKRKRTLRRCYNPCCGLDSIHSKKTYPSVRKYDTTKNFAELMRFSCARDVLKKTRHKVSPRAQKQNISLNHLNITSHWLKTWIMRCHTIVQQLWHILLYWQGTLKSLILSQYLSTATMTRMDHYPSRYSWSPQEP